MARYALIQGGIVANVVEQASAPTIPGQWVEVTGGFGPGDLYSGGVFSKAPGPAVLRRITRLAFFRRFTLDEDAAIELAALDSPGGNPAARRALARSRVATRRVTLSPFVDLDDAEVRATVQGYEAAVLLAAGRALVILEGEVLASERP